MMQSILNFFNSENFMPHGHCFLWEPGILWLHVLSDAGIALAYYAIPLALLYFVRHRTDLPFKNLFVLFAAFIVLCGTTHLLSIWVLWHPDYAVEGMVKALTAIASIGTFIVLLELMPKALKLVTPENLGMAQLALRLQGSEAKLRAMIDTAQDAVVAMDDEGLITEWNRQAEVIFGWSHTEAIGQPLHELILPAPRRQKHLDRLRQYLETGTGLILNSRIELTGLNRKGVEFPVELTITATKVSGRYFFSAFIRDITDRKAAEEIKRHYTEDLERSNRELDEFSHIASHDLKEPLRGMRNHALFLLEDCRDKLDEKDVTRIDRLIYLSTRMEQLVGDLLHYAQLGRAEHGVVEADPNAMIEDIRNMLESLLAEHNARITVPKPLPHVACDKVRITEVFRNLVTNAVKYNDKAAPVVEVGFLETADGPRGPEKNVFYVRDNGIGIAAQHHEDIFRIFKRLQTSRDGQTEGTGAGLTFVKKIIERGGGRIWLESTPGAGTTFYFTVSHHA